MSVIAAIAVAGIAAASPPAAPAPSPPTPPPAAAAPLGAAPPEIVAPPVDPAPAIREAFQAAESLQGPLDGAWRLTDDNGHPVLILELCDPGPAQTGGPALVQGAWRDPNRTGMDSSGFLAEVARQGDGLSIRFYEGVDGDTMVVTLRAAANRQWRGELSGQGARRRVVMDPF